MPPTNRLDLPYFDPNNETDREILELMEKQNKPENNRIRAIFLLVTIPVILYFMFEVIIGFVKLWNGN
jgi:hypothetical protein